jgi:DNA-binding Lrp family transcriptional regulator
MAIAERRQTTTFTPPPLQPRVEAPVIPLLTALEKRLLNEFQHGLPLSPTPYADMADKLGSSEQEVIYLLQKLKGLGYISRVGPVFKPQRIGYSTLAAMSVPCDQLHTIADYVSSRSEVNHNYERHNHLNLWFVVTAADETAVKQVLAEVEAHSGFAVLNLPLLKPFHIDLGFPLWN